MKSLINYILEIYLFFILRLLALKKKYKRINFFGDEEDEEDDSTLPKNKYQQVNTYIIFLIGLCRIDRLKITFINL